MCVIFFRRRRNNGNSWPRSVQHWWWQPQVTGGRRFIWGGGEVRVECQWWTLARVWDPAEFDEEPLKEELNYVQIFPKFYLLWCSTCMFFYFIYRFYLHVHLQLVFQNLDPITPIVFVVCVWKNAPISLKASPFHQVSHPFWGQNGLLIFCAYLSELKGNRTEREYRKKKMCWHSNYLRGLKAFQDINVFIKIEHEQLKSFDSVFTDWQMFGWWDEVKSSSRVVFWPGGHLVLNRCWDVFWYSYTYILITHITDNSRVMFFM